MCSYHSDTIHIIYVASCPYLKSEFATSERSYRPQPKIGNHQKNYRNNLACSYNSNGYFGNVLGACRLLFYRAIYKSLLPSHSQIIWYTNTGTIERNFQNILWLWYSGCDFILCSKYICIRCVPTNKWNNRFFMHLGKFGYYK